MIINTNNSSTEARLGSRNSSTGADKTGSYNYARGSARPGGDVTDIAWVTEDRLDEFEFGLWSEARRIIALASRDRLRDAAEPARE